MAVLAALVGAWPGAGDARAAVSACCMPWGEPGPIAFSPDGRHGYVGDRQALLALGRDSDTGRLRLIEGYEPGGADAVAVSPDGRHVYAAGQPTLLTAGHLRVWARDAESGALALVEKYGLKPGAAPREVVLSADGRFAYLSWADGTIGVFARDSSSGRLSLVQGLGPANGLSSFSGLGALELSADGRQLYAAASMRLGAFARDPESGRITLVDTEDTLGEEGMALDHAGDRLYHGPYGLSELSRDADGGTTLLHGVRTSPIMSWTNEGSARLILATPTAVYVLDDGRSRLYQGRRTEAGLELTRTYREFADGARGLRGAHTISLSPDGRDLYVTAAPPPNSMAGAGSVSTFRRDPQTGDLRFTSIYRGPFFDGGENPPTLTIDDGAKYTNDRHVEITIPPKRGFFFPFSLSNDGGFRRAVTVEPSPDGRYSWLLDSSGPERLAKTVYAHVWYRGESLVIADDIVLDEGPPSLVDVQVVPAGARGSRVRFAAEDEHSGVAAVQVTTTRSRGGRWRRYRSQSAYAVPAGRNWARVQDRAGNRSEWRRFVVRRRAG